MCLSWVKSKFHNTTDLTTVESTGGEPCFKLFLGSGTKTSDVTVEWDVSEYVVVTVVLILVTTVHDCVGRCLVKSYVSEVSDCVSRNTNILVGNNVMLCTFCTDRRDECDAVFSLVTEVNNELLDGCVCYATKK